MMLNTNDKREQPAQYAGIHLSGPNAPKSAVVILSRQRLPFKITKVYEKIGSFGRLFSDERIVEILQNHSPLREVFVDCPLSEPPCVTCTRAACPGVNRCDDLGVAYMLALADKAQRGPRARPVNPQSQRLWDIYSDRQRVAKGLPRQEPSYSSNMAPLVIRARTLQRRLAGSNPHLLLKETSVAQSLEAVAPLLCMTRDDLGAYRHFDKGADIRVRTLEAMVTSGWLALPDEDEWCMVTESVEAFKALITAWVAVLFDVGLTTKPPQDYLPENGWVHLPMLSELSPHSLPTW